MFSRLWRLASRPHKHTNVILDVHAEHKPFFLKGAITGEDWRHENMGKTLQIITDPPKLNALQTQAELNIKKWAQKRADFPRSVEVIYQDWGHATLDATKKYGTPYSVLNMANSRFPGGAALEGGSAQEENMWLRSSCALSLLDKIVQLDSNSRTFRYTDEAAELLQGQVPMSQDELTRLQVARGLPITEAFKVYFSPDQRICFRGAEVLVPSNSEDLGTSRFALVPDSFLSFGLLPQSDVFSFYELRSAAPERVAMDIDMDDKEALEHYKNDLRRRIGAQLDTLIIEGKTNVILGAWGCGAFKNTPEVVAELYREEIEKRSDCFDHIVFPILKTDNQMDNYAIFDKCLSGMKLGSPMSADSTFRM